MIKPRSHAVAAARFLSGAVLLLCVLLGPFLPVLAAQRVTGMSCCKRGSAHSCCARKAKQGPALQSAPDCGKTCCGKPQIQPVAAIVVAQPSSRVAAPVVVHPLQIAGTGRLRPVELGHSLFQRPPPHASSL